LGYSQAAAATKDGKAAVIVIAPTAGGPADRAGIRPQDLILSVNGREVSGLSLYEVSDLLRGDEGTSVDVRVDGGAKNGGKKDLTLTRQKISVNPVAYKACGGPEGIGYVR
jgi:carboxyl-terminal processing protease